MSEREAILNAVNNIWMCERASPEVRDIAYIISLLIEKCWKEEAKRNEM
jgi:hypothetical protein